MEFTETAQVPDIFIETQGDPNSKEFRVHALTALTEQRFSLWHDVALYPTPQSKLLNIVNIINEVNYFHGYFYID